MRALIGFLLVLAVAAVAGDFLAERLTTDRAEERLAERGLTDPQVSVSGFPFLPQLLSRDFDEVRVRATGGTVNGTRLRRLELTGRGVQAPDGEDVTARELRARALVPYAEVLRRTDSPVARLALAGPAGSGGGDRVRFTGEVQILGRVIPVDATGRVRAAGPGIAVVPGSLEIEGDGIPLVVAVEEAVRRDFALTYRLRDLPEGTRVSRVAPQREGFLVTVTGRDTVLAGTSDLR